MTKVTDSGPLVTAADVAAQIGNDTWVVIDCRFDLADPGAGRAAWQAGHIPGARYADLDRDLSAPKAPDGAGGRHPLPNPDAIGARLREWGVCTDSRVIAYDDAGGAIAARLWWLLRWLGHRGAAVLDGGLAAWQAAGHALVTQVPDVRQGDFHGMPGSMPVVDADRVAAALADGHGALLDARQPERFSGAVEPLDVRAGHVPGAINTPLTDNLGPDKCFRAPGELRAYYRTAIGGAAPDRVVGMCGSGVTACHVLLALECAGLPGAALYAGSWSDWISHAGRPIATDTNS